MFLFMTIQHNERASQYKSLEYRHKDLKNGDYVTSYSIYMYMHVYTLFNICKFHGRILRGHKLLTTLLVSY